MNINDTGDRCPHCGRYPNIHSERLAQQRETVYRPATYRMQAPGDHEGP